MILLVMVALLITTLEVLVFHTSIVILLAMMALFAMSSVHQQTSGILFSLQGIGSMSFNLKSPEHFAPFLHIFDPEQCRSTFKILCHLSVWPASLLLLFLVVDHVLLVGYKKTASLAFVGCVLILCNFMQSMLPSLHLKYKISHWIMPDHMGWPQFLTHAEYGPSYVFHQSRAHRRWNWVSYYLPSMVYLKKSLHFR